jgi:hypothetical protein
LRHIKSLGALQDVTAAKPVLTLLDALTLNQVNRPPHDLAQLLLCACQVQQVLLRFRDELD